MQNAPLHRISQSTASAKSMNKLTLNEPEKFLFCSNKSKKCAVELYAIWIFLKFIVLTMFKKTFEAKNLRSRMITYQHKWRVGHWRFFNTASVQLISFWTLLQQQQQVLLGYKQFSCSGTTRHYVREIHLLLERSQEEANSCKLITVADGDEECKGSLFFNFMQFSEKN